MREKVAARQWMQEQTQSDEHGEWCEDSEWWGWEGTQRDEDGGDVFLPSHGILLRFSAQSWATLTFINPTPHRHIPPYSLGGEEVPKHQRCKSSRRGAVKLHCSPTNSGEKQALPKLHPLLRDVKRSQASCCQSSLSSCWRQWVWPNLWLECLD